METTYLGPWLDLTKKEYEDLLNSLNPEPGTCIFLDVCDSTELKRIKPFKQWITIIRTSLVIGQTLPSLEQPLKVIGDELMYYITDAELKSSGENYATLFDSVKKSISSFGPTLDSYKLTLKGAIHYCENAYPVSMIGERKSVGNGKVKMIPTKDVYGNDIDLTARFMTKARSKRLIVSEAFKQKVHGVDPSFLKGIQGPYMEDFKGFVKPEVYYYFSL